MIPSAEKKCHHTAFEKSCRSLVANGICDRWKNLPGPTPFKMDAKPSEWGCVDDMVWYVAGEAAVQGHGGHKAITQFREMVLDRSHSARQISQENAETQKAIEVQS